MYSNKLVTEINKQTNQKMEIMIVTAVEERAWDDYLYSYRSLYYRWLKQSGEYTFQLLSELDFFVYRYIINCLCCAGTLRSVHYMNDAIITIRTTK